MAERLQKVLAKAGYGSRRSCETLIKSGKVKVNGQRAWLGQKVDPTRVVVEVNGQRIKTQDLIYIMLNKPKGILSSTVDELNQGRPTIRDLVDVPEHLYPVGRLDKNSQGLILLTNDGELTHRLTHPRYEHSKRYRAKLEGSISDEAVNKWRAGIWLDKRKTAPVAVHNVARKRGKTTITIVMREGRKRQIRRVASQLGYPVIALKRDKIGPIKLGDLAEGRWRHLTNSEIISLKRAAFPEKYDSDLNEVFHE